MDKKGKMEWEYLAAIVLVLLIVVLILLFSEGIKQQIIEAGQKFFSGFLPEKLGQ